ncbi:MAG: ABC transporter permease [Gemmatimonadota bacterium]|nr:ABC transporter permease [Gemmatimonadota bacterium]
MWSRLRRVIRRLSAAPAFALVAIVTLALGIGANTAIFSVVNGVLLESLPFEDSDELVFFQRGTSAESDVSIPDGVDIRSETALFEQVGLYNPFWAFDIVESGEPERAAGMLVEPEYFQVLRTPPLIGRVLLPADNVIGGERVVLLSEGFWQRRFGGDPDVVGTSMQLTGEPHTVVGVMPSEFDFLQAGTDVWTPIAVTTPWAPEERGTNNLEAIARLAPGVPLSAAAAEIEAITTRLADAYPDTNQGKVVTAVALRDRVVGGSRLVLWLLFGAVGLVLLIACVNVANLFMVRSTVRGREVAVRMALGGSRLRVAASALGEALVLAAVGGALGTLIAVWGTEALVAAAPPGLPRADGIDIDRAVLAFTFGVSLLTALLFGWVPAMNDMRRDPAELLSKGGARGAAGRTGRFLGGFVVAEVALAAVLLVGSGLLVRSFMSLRAVDLGFDPQNVITANFVLPENRYSEREVQDAAFEQLVRSLNEAPGVESGAFVLGAPMVGYGAIGSSIQFDDRPVPPAGERPSARLRLVHGDYFGTVHVPILRGRPFADTDRADAARVAIVNETLAEGAWPGENPIGKRVAVLMTGEPDWYTVIGVAGDVEQNGVATGDPSTLYLPYTQRGMSWARFGTLVARGPVDFGTLDRAVKDALWTVDPTVPFDGIAPLGELVDASIAPQRFSATLVALFAALALVIALQGLYGVLSYSVAQRRGEIGVRMALGARSGDVLGLVVRRGAVLVGVGLLVGLVAAGLTTRLIRGALYGVTGTDPLTYAIVAGCLALTALVACAVPAAQAARLDPMRTLRDE